MSKRDAGYCIDVQKKGTSSRNVLISERSEFCVFQGFWPTTFLIFQNFFKNRMKKFKLSIKLCAFFYTYCINFCKKKNIGNVAIFHCKCVKLSIFTHVAKIPNWIFFTKIYYCPFDSSWNSRKSIKFMPSRGGAFDNTQVFSWGLTADIPRWSEFARGFSTSSSLPGSWPGKFLLQKLTRSLDEAEKYD
jgi:hypothetical protein